MSEQHWARRLGRRVRQQAPAPQADAPGVPMPPMPPMPPMNPAGAGAASRGMTTLFVDHPWGWLWWDPEFLLLPGDPDVLDDNVRYPPSGIDWTLVAQAVSFAVAHRGSAADVSTPHVEVEVPFALGREERRTVQCWLSGGGGRVVRLCEPHSPQRVIGDGRHRLWATWQRFEGAIPIMSNTALDFAATYPDDRYDLTDLMQEGLAEERQWWRQEAPARLAGLNRGYIGGLDACLARLREKC
jgi:hypothetical protein